MDSMMKYNRGARPNEGSIVAETRRPMAMPRAAFVYLDAGGDEYQALRALTDPVPRGGVGPRGTGGGGPAAGAARRRPTRSSAEAPPDNLRVRRSPRTRGPTWRRRAMRPAVRRDRTRRARLRARPRRSAALDAEGAGLQNPVERRRRVAAGGRRASARTDHASALKISTASTLPPPLGPRFRKRAAGGARRAFSNAAIPLRPGAGQTA